MCSRAFLILSKCEFSEISKNNTVINNRNAERSHLENVANMLGKKVPLFSIPFRKIGFSIFDTVVDIKYRDGQK